MMRIARLPIRFMEPFQLKRRTPLLQERRRGTTTIDYWTRASSQLVVIPTSPRTGILYQNCAVHVGKLLLLVTWLWGKRQPEQDPYSFVGVEIKVRSTLDITNVQPAAQPRQAVGESDRWKAELVAAPEKAVRPADRNVIKIAADGGLQRQLKTPRGVPRKPGVEPVRDVVVVVRKDGKIEIAGGAEVEDGRMPQFSGRGEIAERAAEIVLTRLKEVQLARARFKSRQGSSRVVDEPCSGEGAPSVLVRGSPERIVAQLPGRKQRSQRKGLVIERDAIIVSAAVEQLDREP